MEAQVAGFARAHSMKVLQGRPLTEIVRHLMEARWYLGNDSGISHLAAFCGAETFALFGPTSPQEWGPKGDHVHFLYNELHPMEWIDSIHASRTIQTAARKI
jgi:ADP-heptose:LPS heptosyltransferase